MEGKREYRNGNDCRSLVPRNTGRCKLGIRGLNESDTERLRRRLSDKGLMVTVVTPKRFASAKRFVMLHKVARDNGILITSPTDCGEDKRR